jgi:hypothetical protein
MLERTAVLTFLGLSVLAAGCSDSENRLTATAPAPFAAASGGDAFSTRIDPPFVSAQPTGRGACPLFEPLRASMILNVQADAFDLRLHEIRMQFFDASGIAAPQVTLPAPVLTVQFGTALVRARSFRSFPLDFLFGCGTGRRGTIVVIVQTRDDRGNDRFNEARVSVR